MLTLICIGKYHNMSIDEDEVFKDVCGFKGSDILGDKYSVSNYGRIYNKIDNVFCKLSLCGNPQYYYVTLTHNNVRKTLRVHRLVAFCFVEDNERLPMVDHIDRDRLNNYYTNLRWISREGNRINSDRFDSCLVNNMVSRCDLFVKLFNKSRADNRKINRILSFKDKIRYVYKHEYASKEKLSKKYNVSLQDINSILKDISPKQHKPKFNYFNAKHYYNKNTAIFLYLNGEKSRKKISKILGVANIDGYLYGLPLYRNKTLSKEIRKEIYDCIISGMKNKEIIEKYNVTKNMIKNIKYGKVKF